MYEAYYMISACLSKVGSAVHESAFHLTSGVPSYPGPDPRLLTHLGCCYYEVLASGDPSLLG